MMYFNHPAGKADESQFLGALRDPFAPGAIGCRVVDSYSMPTATYHIRSAVRLVSNSTGDMFCAFLPSPCFSYVQPSTGQGGPAAAPGLTGFTQNNGVAGGTGGGYLLTPTAVANVLTEYRTVSWGLRFVAKDTALSSKGKVYIAPIPTTDNNPSWNTMDTVTGTTDSIGEFTLGLPLQSLNQIVNLPGVRCFSMQDLLRGEVMAVGTPTNGSFYEFRGTADRHLVAWNTNQNLADEIVYSNAGAVVNATAGGRKDVSSLRGGRAFAIFATGLPVSTNEFDIELVYHLEGTPNVHNASGNPALVPSSMRPTIGSTSLVERVLAIASKATNVVQFLRDPTNIAAATRAMAMIGF